MLVNDTEVRTALTAMLRELREDANEDYPDDFNLGRELDSIQILQLIGKVHEQFGLMFGQDTSDIALLDAFGRFYEWVRDHAKHTV